MVLIHCKLQRCACNGSRTYARLYANSSTRYTLNSVSILPSRQHVSLQHSPTEVMNQTDGHAALSSSCPFQSKPPLPPSHEVHYLLEAEDWPNWQHDTAISPALVDIEIGRARLLKLDGSKAGKPL